MKFGRKIISTRGLYNTPRILVRPSRPPPDSFYGILLIIFRLLVHIFFNIFRANMKKNGRTYFSPQSFTLTRGHSWGVLGTSLVVFMKDWSHNPNFNSHGSWPENDKILLEFSVPSFTKPFSN